MADSWLNSPLFLAAFLREKTMEEALANIKEAIEGSLEVMK